MARQALMISVYHNVSRERRRQAGRPAGRPPRETARVFEDASECAADILIRYMDGQMQLPTFVPIVGKLA